MEEYKGCDNCAYEHTDETQHPCRMCKNNWFPSDPRHNMYSLQWVSKQDEPSGSNVDHPAHYQGRHECIDEMIALFGVEAVKAFCKCNVYKYRYRADRKNGQEDLDKADFYMDYLMKLIAEGEQDGNCKNE